METFETKEEKLHKLFLQYLRKIKDSLGQRVEYRVHGGNQVNKLMTEFKTDKEKGVATLIDQFLKDEYKGEITEIELDGLKVLAENEIEQYLNQIEQEAYAQMRKYIDSRYYETVGSTKTVVPEHIIGSDIRLLDVDRSQFEQNIKKDFLSANGPMRSNKYGLTGENLPGLDEVIREEVDKLVAAKG